MCIRDRCKLIINGCLVSGAIRQEIWPAAFRIQYDTRVSRAWILRLPVWTNLWFTHDKHMNTLKAWQCHCVCEIIISLIFKGRFCSCDVFVSCDAKKLLWSLSTCHIAAIWCLKPVITSHHLILGYVVQDPFLVPGVKPTVGWGELDCPSIMTGSDIRPCHTASMGWLESYLSSVVCSFEVL